MVMHGSYKSDGLWDVYLTNVITAIAAAEDVNPNELTPLYDVIDPEALEQFLQNSDEPTHVTFQYERWEVDVRGDGVVDVTKSSNGA